MLTRIYIDNFRCLVNFEYRPRRQELILGGNGSGKSSLLDVLLFLQQFIARGVPFDDFRLLAQRTRWLNRPHITTELEAELDGGRYVYRLVIEPRGEPAKPRAASETLCFEGKSLFEFINGEVQLFDDRFERKAAYELDPARSALATIIPRGDNQKLSRFKRWLGSFHGFRINPFAMSARAEGEELYPKVDLSNLAAWYRHLVQAVPRPSAALRESLRECIEGFNFLELEPFGENVRLLRAEFAHGGKTTRFYFNELSDGQRCLIALYTILHFVVAQGGAVVLDEPENFVSLREIQPWLMALSDAI